MPEITPDLAAQADITGIPDTPDADAVAAPAAPGTPVAPTASPRALALRAELGIHDPAPAVPSRVAELRQEFGLTPAPAPRVAKTPAGAAAADQSDPSWADTLSTAAGNVLPSAGKLFAGMAHAVVNPSETLGNIEQLGKGVVSKAAGALGVTQVAA